MSRPAAPADPPDAERAADVVRLDDPARAVVVDRVAHEEPLEIQLGARSLTVVMRTPGHDEELALGFLVTERVIRTRADVVALHHDRIAAEPAVEDNILRVHLRPDLPVDFESLRRNVYASASCGLCGKTTIAATLQSAPPLDDAARFPAAFFHDLPARLRTAQAGFATTGGLHAAALVAPDGTLRVVREDVGRHNAVDKVVGWALARELLPLAGHVLLVSGRISYEIAQKALAARIPAVAAVSAPSSLAVELATAARMLLVGFLRDGRGNAYGHTQRLAAH